MTNEWRKTFDQIRNKHDESYKTIDMAIKFEENEQQDLAYLNYKIGISIIDEGLQIPVALPDDPKELDESWNEACKMIHKMKRTRVEVLQRIGTLSIELCHPNDSTKLFTSASNKNNNNNNNDITLNEVNSNREIRNCRPRTYTELAQALQNLQCNSDNFDNNILELLFSCDNVKFYNISSNGEVSTTPEEFILRIVSIAQDDIKYIQKTYFLQLIKSSDAIKIDNLEDNLLSVANNSETNNNVNETDQIHKKYDIPWIYPLVPGASPCFRTDYRAFIFPDLQSDVNGSAVGMVIPMGSDEIVLEILEAILHGVVKQSVEVEEDKEDNARYPHGISGTVSDNIVRGASYISNGLVKGSEKFCEFVTYSTPYIISKLGHAPQNAPPVSESVRNGVEIAKSATAVAANVTGYLAGRVTSATMALGRFLAPHIQAQGSRLLSHTMGISQDEATEKMSGVLTIAAGAVEGFGTVYSGLEQSASILGTNLSNNSVKIIEHKYGPSAGTVASGTFDTVGNMINFSQNMNYITPKGIAKRTAKNTGKAVIVDYKSGIQKGTNVIPAGALYPDLSEFAREVSTKSPSIE